MKFVVDGVPTAWSSHKGYGKRSYSLHTPKKQAFQRKIRQQYDGPLFDSPISLSITFEMPIPESFSKKKRLKIEAIPFHTSRPDLTNLQKFAEDCLSGIVISDDKIVVKTSSQKYYSKSPQTIIEIEVL